MEIEISDNFEQKERTANTGLIKVAVQYSADTFMVNQSLVLRINICGKNRQLLVAAKRYKQFNLNKNRNDKTEIDCERSMRPIPQLPNQSLTTCHDLCCRAVAGGVGMQKRE
jgi:hypothetical protein